MASETSISDVAIAGISEFGRTVRNAQDSVADIVTTPFDVLGGVVKSGQETAKSVLNPYNLAAFAFGSQAGFTGAAIVTTVVLGGATYVVIKSGAGEAIVKVVAKGAKAVGSVL